MQPSRQFFEASFNSFVVKFLLILIISCSVLNLFDKCALKEASDVLLRFSDLKFQVRYDLLQNVLKFLTNFPMKFTKIVHLYYYLMVEKMFHLRVLISLHSENLFKNFIYFVNRWFFIKKIKPFFRS